MDVNKIVIYFKKNQTFGVYGVHDSTVRRVLNRYGYHYRQARRKGLLKENDLKLRMKFEKDIKKY